MSGGVVAESLMKREDFEGPPCSCPACFQAGVSEQPQIRDRYTGKWLHGQDLRRWYEAKAKFEELAKTIKAKSI